MATHDYTENESFKQDPCYCSCCGRPLDDATSREFGIGPWCRKKYGYEDAYPISPAKQRELCTLLTQLTVPEVASKACVAIQNDDSRAAANVLNRQSAYWRAEGSHEADMRIVLEVLVGMGYVALASAIGKPYIKVTIEAKSNRLHFKTGYEPAFISSIKKVKGRRYHPKDKIWSVPVNMKKDAWDILKLCFEGEIGMGPKGIFAIK
jgi:hypothetical protein